MRRHDLEDKEMEVIWVQVKMRKLEASIGNVYRPLDAPAAWMDSLAVMSVNVIQEQLTVMMMGDFH